MIQPNFNVQGNPGFVRGYNNRKVNGNSCDIAVVNSNTTYYYCVRAKNESGDGLLVEYNKYSYEYDGAPKTPTITVTGKGNYKDSVDKT